MKLGILVIESANVSRRLSRNTVRRRSLPLPPVVRRPEERANLPNTGAADRSTTMTIAARTADGRMRCFARLSSIILGELFSVVNHSLLQNEGMFVLLSWLDGN